MNLSNEHSRFATLHPSQGTQPNFLLFNPLQDATMCAAAPEPTAVQDPLSVSRIRPKLSRPEKRMFFETKLGIIIMHIISLFVVYELVYKLAIPEHGQTGQ
jgi:hypothetical protein